jgi:hypothetical protein
MNLLKDKEISLEQWQELIENSDTSSFFQTKSCYDLYCSLSFLQGFVYAIKRNDELQALVCGYIVADGNKLKQFFSKRAIIPGGMLISKKCASGSIQSLLDFVIADLNKKAIYIEFRNFNDYSNYKVEFEKVGFDYQSHLNYQLDSTYSKKLFANLSESKQRQIKQTEKAGVICVPVSNKEEIAEFYQILQNLYREKIGLPLFPLEFF